MKFKKRFLMVFCSIALLGGTMGNGSVAADTGLAATRNDGFDTSNAGYFDKGPVALAVEKALTIGGPIKEDLINRGLFTFPTSDGKSGRTPGEIKVGDIEKLVNSGIYVLDNISGLAIRDQNSTDEIQKEPESILVDAEYKYAQMVTRTLEWVDVYNYRGHFCWVSIPANVTLAQGTVHNVYTHHMGLPRPFPWSPKRFVESGVGWVSWAPSPIIFTYDTYNPGWVYDTIPGGISRDIYLLIDISPSYQAQMFVWDPYSNKSIQTFRQVDELNHRIDVAQEQASFAGVWTQTSYARFFDNIVKNTAGNWVNWNNSIDTDWDNNPPLYEGHGILNDKKWIETWANP